MNTDAELHRIIRKLAEAELPDGIVPFASLRVECHHSEFSHRNVTVRCPHWRPEPDVEKACHRIKALLEIMGAPHDIDYNHSVKKWQRYDRRNLPNHKGWTNAGSHEEAVLRVGEAWLDERMKEIP